MFTATIFQISLVLATLLTTLTTGFILIFAIVVMPGISTLPYSGYLRAFQVIDGMVQNRQPIFGLVWGGSVLTLIATVVLGVFGFVELGEWARALLIIATLSYLLGTQLTTITVHLPLNNHVQTLDIATLDDATLQTEREKFEARWTRWNIIRTAFAAISSVLLIIVLRLQ